MRHQRVIKNISSIRYSSRLKNVYKLFKTIACRRKAIQSVRFNILTLKIMTKRIKRKQILIINDVSI